MHKEIVAKVLKVNLIDAQIWLDRIESWDEIDWSEWSETKINKHIKNFVSDWENLYSKVVGA